MRRALWSKWFVLCLLTVVSIGCSSSAPHYRQSHAAAYANTDGMYGGGGRGEAMVLAQSEGVGGEVADTPARRASRERASANSQAARAPVKRRLVRNGWLTIELPDRPDFEPSLEKLRGIATSFDGYVQSETAETMKIMIPTDRFDEAMEKVSGLGDVTYRNVSVVDVTARYVDMQIRRDNLEQMRVRLTELIAQSDDVSQILEIEKELGRVTMEIERLAGQLRLMDQQTSYATIDVTFEEKVYPGPLGWVFYGVAMGVKWLFVWD